MRFGLEDFSPGLLCCRFLDLAGSVEEPGGGGEGGPGPADSPALEFGIQLVGRGCGL